MPTLTTTQHAALDALRATPNAIAQLPRTPRGSIQTGLSCVALQKLREFGLISCTHIYLRGVTSDDLAVTAAAARVPVLNAVAAARATASKRTAEHAGHCQVCGALQLLPAGRLAKHGYTVTYGFFNGTCYGSDELPFEQSIALVLDSIERATAHRTRLLQQIETLRTVDSTPRAVVSFYRAAERVGRGTVPSRYDAHDVEITLTEATHTGRNLAGETSTYTVRTFSCVDPKTAKTVTLGSEKFGYTHPATLADAVRILNEKRAAALESRDLAEIDRYLAMQRARIEKWTPQPLLPRGAKR